MTILNPNQIVEQLHVMQEIARRYECMVHWRAVQAYQAAFGHVAKPGDHLDGCIIHNSLVGYETGKPWTGIDYNQMRKARWLLDERQFLASRLVSAWYSRKWSEWQAAGCPRGAPSLAKLQNVAW